MFHRLIPQMYSRSAFTRCAVPFMPRPIAPAPFFGGFGSPFVPMMSRMPAPVCATPFSFGFPMLACGNIFIQNMMQIASRITATARGQSAMLAQVGAANAYKFGSITAHRASFNPVRYTSPISTFWANYPTNSSYWNQIGYCASSGLRLARTAMSRAVGFVGYCARYVKNAIASCGLGFYVSGNAHDMIGILRNNRNFREIPARGVNPKTLPAGCVLVYERGVAGYSSRYGHTEITTGDGRAVSDGITTNIRGNVTAIFVPVA